MTRDESITRNVLVTVKAAPNPSTTHGETVCVAGVTREDGWLRLHPVPFRDLPRDKQFQKYQWIALDLIKHRGDTRPESYRPDLATLVPGEIISSRNDWAERRKLMTPNVSTSMCEIQRQQSENGKSLGMFKPAEVLDLIIEDEDATWSHRKQEIIGQQFFFSDRKKRLEKIPMRFLYKYRCNDPRCNGHTQSIVDWEISQLYRRLTRQHSDKERIKELIRNKFFDELCGESKDTHFFVGNTAAWRNGFLVLGVFWPPRRSPDRAHATGSLLE